MVIFEVNQEQFFQYFPPETRNIIVNGEVVENLGKEVICDKCNRDVFIEDDDHAFLISFVAYPTTNDITDVFCAECAAPIIQKSTKVE